MQFTKITYRLIAFTLVFILSSVPQIAAQQTTPPVAQPTDPQASTTTDIANPPPSQTDQQEPNSTPAEPGSEAVQPEENENGSQLPQSDAEPAIPEPDPQQGGTSIDPAQGPLEPVPTTETPDAPSTIQQQPAQQPGQTQPQQGGRIGAPRDPTKEPAGTAAAERVETTGGAASRPAGVAIAPAKQRQTRSFLIKLGFIAGAAAALGTVFALSKGSPSTPPGAENQPAPPTPNQP